MLSEVTLSSSSQRVSRTRSAEWEEQTRNRREMNLDRGDDILSSFLICGVSLACSVLGTTPRSAELGRWSNCLLVTSSWLSAYI